MVHRIANNVETNMVHRRANNAELNMVYGRANNLESNMFTPEQIMWNQVWFTTDEI